MSVLLSLEVPYVLTGVLLGVFAILTWRDAGNRRRVTSGVFWCLLGGAFAFGSVLPHRVTGFLVLALVALEGAGLVGAGDAPRDTRTASLGNRTIVPVLEIPVLTILGGVGFRLAGLDVNRGVLLGLGFGAVAAGLAALLVTRAGVPELLREGQRLNETMGAVNILPQLLAALGVVFTAAKVGELIARGIHSVVPHGSLFLLVLANCAGMLLFTGVMGNTFAAFPVIAAGITVPLIVKPLGVDPALAGIFTLTAGSSGTLLTVMAANFNIIPVALLNMRDAYGVIRFQIPYALAIWGCHVLLLWALIAAGR